MLKINNIRLLFNLVSLPQFSRFLFLFEKLSCKEHLV